MSLESSLEQILREILSQTDEDIDRWYPQDKYPQVTYREDIRTCAQALIRQNGGRSRAATVATDESFALRKRVIVVHCL